MGSHVSASGASRRPRKPENPARRRPAYPAHRRTERRRRRRSHTRVSRPRSSSALCPFAVSSRKSQMLFMSIAGMGLIPAALCRPALRNFFFQEGHRNSAGASARACARAHCRSSFPAIQRAGQRSVHIRLQAELPQGPTCVFSVCPLRKVSRSLTLVGHLNGPYYTSRLSLASPRDFALAWVGDSGYCGVQPSA